MKGIMAPPKLLSKFFFIGSAKRFALSIFTLMLFSSNQVAAMSMIGFKVCLASESSALVTSNREPVVGATVKRKVKSNHNGKDYLDETTTDQEGRFSFPAIYSKYLFKHFPSEAVIHQEVTIEHEGESHRAWMLTKADWDENSEVNDRADIKSNTAVPFSAKCELTNTESSFRLAKNYQVIVGKCKIDNVEEAYRSN